MLQQQTYLNRYGEPTKECDIPIVTNRIVEYNDGSNDSSIRLPNPQTSSQYEITIFPTTLLPLQNINIQIDKK